MYDEHRMYEVALFAAIEAGEAASVRDVLALGVSPDASTSDGWPALFLAIGAGNVGAAEALLDHGAKLNLTMDGDPAILFAACHGQVAIARMLVVRGVDVNQWGRDGDTALLAAAQEGNTELTTLFLQVGVSAYDTGRSDGIAPLGMAAMMGHPDVVRLLLDGGVNPARRDLAGLTPLDRALEEDAREPSELRQAAIRMLNEALTRPR